MNTSDGGTHDPAGPPARFFEREDTSDDRNFYTVARLVTHIDDATIASLTRYYARTLSEGSRVLDLMSSWISHLPPGMTFAHVAGLGMNAAELTANPRLDERLVHDLNADPTLPWPDATFDAVTIAVSVQYLVRPFAVFDEIGRVLAPGGRCIVAMSHRMFPTKAVFAFHALGPEDRMRLVGSYLQRCGRFSDIVALDESPQAADPLWIVQGTRNVDAGTA